MNITPMISNFYGWLIEAPEPILLFLKITILLLIGWAGHLLLKNRNPRWRVILWRSVSVGIFILPIWSLAGPVFLVSVSKPVTLENSEEQAPVEPIFESEQPLSAFNQFAQNETSNTELPENYSQANSDESLKTTTPTKSAIVQPPVSSFSFTKYLPVVLSFFWFMGLGAFLLRLFVGRNQIFRITQNATDCPDWVQEIYAYVSKDMNCSKTMPLKQVSKIHSPFLFGLRKPILFLPEYLCSEEHREDLPAIFAHEISHLKSHDLHWHLLLYVQSAILWFHPLAWKMTSAHLSVCELVSDNISASMIGDASAYSRTLAKVASRIIQSSPTTALAMARVSDITRRLDALQKKLFDSPIRKRKVVLFSILSILFTFTIASFQLGYAESKTEQGTDTKVIADNKLEDSSESKDVEFTVIDKETKKPLSNITLEITYAGIYKNDSKIKSEYITIKTDKNGKAIWKKPNKSKHKQFYVKVILHEHVSVLYEYYTAPINYEYIDIPGKFLVELEPGTTIGGILHDSDGKPIKDAKIGVFMPVISPQNNQPREFEIDTLQTDEEGKWETNAVTYDLANVSLRIKHKEYTNLNVPLKKQSESDLREKKLVLIIEKGFSIIGQVLNKQDLPVEGATVIFGDYQVISKTDKNGKFILKKCRKGDQYRDISYRKETHFKKTQYITVYKEGYAPKLIENELSDKYPPLAIHLNSQPSTLTGTVNDITGNPVENVKIIAHTWRGVRTLENDFATQTDKLGNFELKNIPNESVQFELSKTGYLRSKLLKIIPTGNKITLTIHPILKISGNVTDAETGKVIKNYKITQGIKIDDQSLIWSRQKNIVKGSYKMEFHVPYNGHAIKVEANGYTSETSPVFKNSDKPILYNFQLKKKQIIIGKVN